LGHRASIYINQSALPFSAVIEKRKYQRYRVSKRAELHLTCGQVLPCRMAELSVGGVRLVLEQKLQSPTSVVSVLLLDESLLYPCRIRWIEDRLAGVEFIGEAERTGPVVEEVEQALQERDLYNPFSEHVCFDDTTIEEQIAGLMRARQLLKRGEE
jgi:hypothetical protein